MEPGNGHSAPVSAPFDAADVASCLKVLEAIVADRVAFAEVDQPTRTRLLIAAGLVSRPDGPAEKRLSREFRRRNLRARRAQDQALLEDTGIRSARRAPVFVTPLPEPTEDPALPAPAAAPAPEAAPASSGAGAEPGAPDPTELRDARRCYICKTYYTRVHSFYDQLCRACGDFNFRKRTQTARLDGRQAIVTGGRVKIGYQSAILMLRAGARVVVTTRFPHDAADRFAREADFDAWRDRLEVYGLDLRHTPSVELFARHLGERLERLDFIIHNACQTVRRPPGFYAHLLEREAAPLAALPAPAQGLVARWDEVRRARVAGQLPGGLANPAALSQLALTEDDRVLPGADLHLFPRGALDADLQQVDLRAVNSWRLTLGEVPTVELLEVHLVNAVAPFVLSSRLKPLMLRHPARDKHIVNVSAVEGQFNRGLKTDKHPHTNMAKAALNMLTRTSAQDLVRDGIHMNSVDTGWVTDENPIAVAQRSEHAQGMAFHPPLDIVDGAARIVDPIFAGFLTGVHAWGKFFKDYEPTEW